MAKTKTVREQVAAQAKVTSLVTAKRTLSPKRLGQAIAIGLLRELESLDSGDGCGHGDDCVHQGADCVRHRRDWLPVEGDGVSCGLTFVDVLGALGNGNATPHAAVEEIPG